MKLYTVSEFAEKLGVSVSTLRAWDKEGIPRKCSTGHWA